MAQTVIHVSDLASHLDQEIGVSEWLTVSQERIDQFAEATDDRQWIHTDPERAARESPFGTTIAHGFLTLSLVTALFNQVVEIAGIRMGVNHGINNVRFMAPVPVGSRLRLRVSLMEVKELRIAVQSTWAVRIEREDHPKPACTAECVVRFFPDEA